MTIKEAIERSGTKTRFALPSVNKAESMLLPNENVIYAINTNVSMEPTNKLSTKISIKNKLSGVVVLTDRRVFFCSSILGKKEVKEFLIDKIQSMDDISGLLGNSQLRIKSITETLVIDLSKRNLEIMKNEINLLIQNRSSKEVSNKPTGSGADEILKYKSLLDQGIITQEEFDKKKKELLGL